METAENNILFLGIAYIILGAILRVIIISIMIIAVRSGVKDKKKKKSVTLSIKDPATKLFIGYVAFFGFLYYIVIDFTKGGLDHEFNSFIWFGLFIVELSIAIPHMVTKIKSILNILNKQKLHKKEV